MPRKSDAGSGSESRKAAMKLLERMDYTERKLREKLKSKEFSEEEIDDAVEYVKSFHYLDDARYAETYIRYHEAGKSALRLRQDLMKKGVDHETIDRVMAESYGGDEEELIRQLLLKKHYDPDMDPKEKQKIYAFLLRRGFPGAKVSRQMKLAEFQP